MVVSLFETLKSTRLVADRTGINPKTILYILNQAGVKTPRAGRRHNPYCACDRNAELVLKMAKDGHSMTQIAKTVKTKPQEVRKFLERNNAMRVFPTFRTGRQHHEWKEKLIDADGYVIVHVPGHPYARKGTDHVREHRLVMERHLGRHLLPTEVVHHKDKVKSNNDISNLQLFQSNGEHLAHELKGRVPKWSPEGKARILEGRLRGSARLRKSNRTL